MYITCTLCTLYTTYILVWLLVNLLSSNTFIFISLYLKLFTRLLHLLFFFENDDYVAGFYFKIYYIIIYHK